MTKILEGLNERQQQAIQTTEIPLLVMAGAGSGKTRVLTYRIAYLIQEKNVAPRNILAVTFTNKSAQEMQQRIHQLVGEKAEKIWISTFHSMCLRILRRNINQIGYNRNFSVIDTKDQSAVIQKLLKENEMSKNYDTKTILGYISKAKNNLLFPNEEKINSSYYGRVEKVYQQYQSYLKRNGVLDFDDLIMLTVHLLKSNQRTLEFYQRKFEYIHIDEYQDGNQAQYVLMRMLSDKFKKICVVGDVDQNLYRWRGADVRHILSFEKDYDNAQTILLEQNYRSTKTILEASNAVITHNKNRMEKNLWTENEQGNKIWHYYANNARDEGTFIADRIKMYVQKGDYSYQDIAILYRTNEQSRFIEEALLLPNIPHKIVGGTRFYDRREIRDILAYLRFIVNPNDEISFSRIVNVPRRGIGKSSIAKIIDYADNNNISISVALEEVEHMNLGEQTTDMLNQFQRMIEEWRSMQMDVTITDMLIKVISDTGYEKMLEAEGESEAKERKEHIKTLFSIARNHEEKNEDTSLISFLTDLILEADIDGVGGNKGIENAVVLMSIHSSKGLEFPIVFLVGVEEGILPHERCLKDIDEIESERNLMYVGMTRAEKELHITHARERTRFGRKNYHVKSRFINEILASCLESLN